MRGDVPPPLITLSPLRRFSPRARGCSQVTYFDLMTTLVFPACAGMFLPPKMQNGHLRCFPRVRGDVPLGLFPRRMPNTFSPRARGCSCTRLPHSAATPVFPACAGMFLINKLMGAGAKCFPRVRGDVPHWAGQTYCAAQFSPRARGCSGKPDETLRTHAVFPACAGMFPLWPKTTGVYWSFPRVRGDVPPLPAPASSKRPFSPRARGCSLVACGNSPSVAVFPACAGMFPRGLRAGA